MSNILPFPAIYAPPPSYNLVTSERCERLEKNAIKHGDWEQAEFWRRAAIVVEWREANNDNIVPLRRA